MLVKQCILNGFISNIVGGALIDGNIFLCQTGNVSLGGSINDSMIRNDIILASIYNLTIGTGNTINNNLLVHPFNEFSYNTKSNNYTGVDQSNIFVNQTGNTLDYTHDYHLKSPTTYLGTDGTQVGIYGGITPFKEKGLPSNPQVISKNIATQTDASGNLQINFTVKSQDN